MTEPAELLRAVYRSIQWDRLYQIAPGATREQVEDLFAALGQAAESIPSSEAPDVSGGSVDVYTDGASRGNPGPAGVGIVVTTRDGAEVVAWGESIGETTNNVAEYRACIAGLEKALDLGVDSVRLLSDSQLLVRQINGRYRVKSPTLQPLHDRVRELLDGFENWQAVHIPREKNARADKLASDAAKASKSG